MLFKKRGVFTEEDAKKVVEWMGAHPEEKELIVMAEVVENTAKRRLWDFARAVKLMADMTGEEREVRVEILEGFVSEKVKGIDVEEL
ncbi:hypothetical protein, conserved [Thermococcus kodakarensis KOD1]|uniref:Uncharacterized protein n=1 Tax=Thermococcus kodakarensis (strain ATCC BAA-918 / JCM 12380 / KOD1) TaxID=69014 RepID=Q5JGE7_THEKO|nr:hypothetical protein [Thermococcus kodakarensis]WCN27211.1 hypothetical protein POG15_06075 [Thermococcus kodakarensis]WCN29497.1 hypothetical protein POG21_06070 [Thermococcus kodakarensis]BAD85386.1 hypothetical protein, conserved [Thermococcus kodakarensis KOD1]